MKAHKSKAHKSVYTLTSNILFIIKRKYKDRSFKQIQNFAALKKI